MPDTKNGSRPPNALSYNPALHLPPPMSPWGLPLPLNGDQQPPRSYTHTPNVFCNRKLRSGKWIPEEEKYALEIIKLFEKGRVAGCENGCTLRSYLSQKLHCAPMRISKKFAGKGIGKMVYVSKLNASTSEESEKEHAALMKRVQDAQEKFYQAVFPQKDALSGSLGGFLNPLTAPSSLVMPGIFPGMPPVVPPGVSSIPTLPFAMPYNPGAFPVPTTPAARSTGEEANKNPAVAVSSIAESQNKLRESFLNALYQTQQQQQQQQQHQQQQQQPPPPQQHQQQNAGATKPQAVASAKPASPVQSPPPNTLVAPTLAKAPLAASLQPQQQPQQVSSIKPLTPKDLPDFLSGFEQAAKHAKSHVSLPQQPQATTMQEQYSPPFTSRSFDDFHRFLGKDVIPLQDSATPRTTIHEVAKPGVEVSTGTEKETAPDTMALFTAESYAIFAQESAMAASQHDAYLPHCRATVAVANPIPTPATFDIDGMVNLVSEHVNFHKQDQRKKKGQQPSPPPPPRPTSQPAKAYSPHAWEAPTVATTAAMTRTASTTAAPESAISTRTTTTRLMGNSGDLHFVSGSEPSERSSTDSALESLRGSSNSDTTDNNLTASSNEESEGNSSDDSACVAKRKRINKKEEEELLRKRARQLPN